MLGSEQLARMDEDEWRRMAVPSTTVATPYGYKTTISAPFADDAAAAWFEDIKRVVAGKTSFGQLVDLRGQKPYSEATNKIIQDAMTYVREHGMTRSSVVLASALTKMQIMRLAKEVGMYEYERYFDASSEPEWERKAIDWIEQGIDPDV
jgi:hypothetical protein